MTRPGELVVPRETNLPLWGWAVLDTKMHMLTQFQPRIVIPVSSFGIVVASCSDFAYVLSNSCSGWVLHKKLQSLS